MASNTTGRGTGSGPGPHDSKGTARAFRAMAELMPETMGHLAEQADQIDPAPDMRGRMPRTEEDTRAVDGGPGAWFEVRVEVVRMAYDPEGNFTEELYSTTVDAVIDNGDAGDGEQVAYNTYHGIRLATLYRAVLSEAMRDASPAPARPRGGNYRPGPGPVAPYPRPRKSGSTS